ncbi:ras-related protein Rab-5C isoform X1 [Haliaeetus albicilla]|uniref:ras-related protein Rab-5C isoform X1 n=1 Tax=Haliaeetus albicilla TaxID=8969 RepID=UPI0037E93808
MPALASPRSPGPTPPDRAPPPPGVGGTPHPPPHSRGGTPGCSARPGLTPAGILIRFYTLCPRGLFLQPGRARLPLPAPPAPGAGAGAGAVGRGWAALPPRPAPGPGGAGGGFCAGLGGVSKGGGGVTVAPARFRGCRLSGGCSLGHYPPVSPAPSGNKGSIFPAPASGESLPAAPPLLRGTCPRCRRSPPAPGPPFPVPAGDSPVVCLPPLRTTTPIVPRDGRALASRRPAHVRRCVPSRGRSASRGGAPLIGRRLCLWPAGSERKGWEDPEAERVKAEVRVRACETHLRRGERRSGRSRGLVLGRCDGSSDHG